VDRRGCVGHEAHAFGLREGNHVPDAGVFAEDRAAIAQSFSTARQQEGVKPALVRMNTAEEIHFQQVLKKLLRQIARFFSLPQ
jgi:predicted metal-dependent peptidase